MGVMGAMGLMGDQHRQQFAVANDDVFPIALVTPITPIIPIGLAHQQTFSSKPIFDIFVRI